MRSTKYLHQDEEVSLKECGNWCIFGFLGTTCMSEVYMYTHGAQMVGLGNHGKSSQNDLGQSWVLVTSATLQISSDRWMVSDDTCWHCWQSAFWTCLDNFGYVLIVWFIELSPVTTSADDRKALLLVISQSPWNSIWFADCCRQGEWTEVNLRRV